MIGVESDSANCPEIRPVAAAIVTVVLAGFAVVPVGSVKVLPLTIEIPMFGFLEAVICLGKGSGYGSAITGKIPLSLNTSWALRVGAVTAEIPSRTNGVGLAVVAAKGGL
jgi:hypothetical protein